MIVPKITPQLNVLKDNTMISLHKNVKCVTISVKLVTDQPPKIVLKKSLMKITSVNLNLKKKKITPNHVQMDTIPTMEPVMLVTKLVNYVLDHIPSTVN